MQITDILSQMGGLQSMAQELGVRPGAADLHTGLGIFRKT